MLVPGIAAMLIIRYVMKDHKRVQADWYQMYAANYNANHR